MPQLDRAGICELAEYQQVFNERLKAGQFTDGQILMLYLRLETMGMAMKSPVETTTNPVTALGEFTLVLTALDDDLKPKPRSTVEGLMIDGVWNPTNERMRYGLINNHNQFIPAVDGVFGEYDDGIDMSLFGRELAGAGASSGIDLGSRRI